MKKIFGLAPNVFFLGLVSLFNDFSAEMVLAVMPAFLTVSLGAPPIFIGFLEGFADALASILKIVSGWFSDRIRKRKIVALSGYGLSVFVRWMLALVGNYWQVFVLRIIDRIGKGLRDSPRDALLAESVERSELGKSFGFQRGMDTIGAVLGPMATIALLPILFNSYRLLFLAAFAVGTLAVLSFFFVKESKKMKEPVPGKSLPLSFSLWKFDRGFRIFVVAVFMFGLGAMPLSLMLLKVQDIGFEPRLMPLVYLVYNFSFAFFAFPFGRLSDRIGQKRVLAFGFLTAIGAYLILASATVLPSVLLGFAVFGLYSAMTDGVERALASKLVASEVLASGQGFLAAAVGLSSLLAGLIGGAIWSLWGPTTAFIYGAVMMTIGLITFIRLNGHPANV